MRKSWMLLALFTLLSMSAPQQVLADTSREWWNYRLVAHALGGIDGHTYTNSYEAFAANYEKGFRVFEVDLQLTSDGRLVARHDWTTGMYKHLGQVNPGVKNNEPLSSEQFKALPILNHYRPLDIDDLIRLMQEYPDMYLVTDSKNLDTADIQKQFRQMADSLIVHDDPSVGRRIVPQIYNRNMYDLLEEIFPFDSYIYTLYQSQDSDKQVLNFVKNTPKVKAVTMEGRRATKEFVTALNKLGARTYVHTVNDVTAYSRYLKTGVYGVYTDFLPVTKMKS